MELGTLISYRLNKLPLPKRCRIYRNLNGWKDKSQYSKYTYNRKGLINDIPHIIVNRCVLIVKKEDAHKLISFFKENDVTVFVRDIVLDVSDLKNLNEHDNP